MILSDLVKTVIFGSFSGAPYSGTLDRNESLASANQNHVGTRGTVQRPTREKRSLRNNLKGFCRLYRSTMTSWERRVNRGIPRSL